MGEHATYHIKHDAPLTSDIEGIARPVSAWVRTSPSARAVAADGAAAIAAAWTPPGQIATLILPADTAWNEADGVATVAPMAARARGRATTSIARCAKVLRSGEPAMLMLTGRAVRADGLALAGRIATATGARIIAQGSNARIQRGAGRVPIERLPYPVDQALAVLKDVRHLILVGAKAPVAFFAYPDKPSVLTPDGCQMHQLSHAGRGLDRRPRGAGRRGGRQEERRGRSAARPPRAARRARSRPTRWRPRSARSCPRARSSPTSRSPPAAASSRQTAGAPPHDWLNNMGGSIGLGMPLATGAAVACPDRKVVCLEGDGSGMYTVQALWTQARESLDVTTVVFANRTYAILRHELTQRSAPARRAARPPTCSTSAAPISTGWPSPAAWASPPPARPPPKSSTNNSPPPSPPTAPPSSKLSSSPPHRQAASKRGGAQGTKERRGPRERRRRRRGSEGSQEQGAQQRRAEGDS